MLTAETKVFVVSKKDGSLWKTTLHNWFNSLQGGSRWEEVEVHTDQTVAMMKVEQYKAIAKLAEKLGQMSVDSALAVISEINHRMLPP